MKYVILFAIMAIIYFTIVLPQDRRDSIKSLQHGQSIEIKIGEKWEVARYYCATPFKKLHKVLFNNKVIQVEERFIKVPKR